MPTWISCGPKRNQPVETRGKALQALTRQAGNQVGVDMHAGLAAQEAEVVFQPLVILAALNQRRRPPR